MNFGDWMLISALIVTASCALVAAKERWITPVEPELPTETLTATPIQPGPPLPLDQPPTIEGEPYTYEWDFVPEHPSRGRVPHHFRLTIPISRERYRQYANEQRDFDVSHWGKYAATPMPELDLLAIELAKLHLSTKFNSYDQASNVLCFVQTCVRYEYDWITHPPHRDWPQYPIESLVERTGDCEDHAILAAAVLKRLGFDVALLSMPGHVALGLAAVGDGRAALFQHNGVSYIYGETTATGWRFGDLPDDVRAETVTVLPVVLAVETPVEATV